jgi:hypothetical protein
VADIAEVAGAVEGMEASGVKAGGVADVVQPRGSSNQIFIAIKDGGQGPRGAGDPL